LEGMEQIFTEAEKVANFVLTRLVRQGDKMLPETYTLDWSELLLEQGGRVDIGHAFEWSYLLSSAVERGFPEVYLSHALNFLEYGMRIGYDPVNGGVFAQASPEGKVLSRRREWWDQCEAVRALLHFAILRKRDDLWEPLERTIGFFKKYFIDSDFGGWYQTVEPDGDVVSHDKGNEWKVDYHAVGMCTEAIRLGTDVLNRGQTC
ncbi:MAG: AGE family epimerase/isomerase, partial [Bacteroidota bacterium]